MRRAIALAALAALALPAGAGAKEVGSLTVCGSDGSHKITAHAARQGFMDGGYETLSRERATPFFTVKVAMLHDGEHAGGWTVQHCAPPTSSAPRSTTPSTCGRAPPA